MDNFFLSLIRLGIGNARAAIVPKHIDWNQLEELATRQGLAAVIFDGISKLPKEQMPPKLMLVQWIGKVHQFYEQRYKLYLQAISDLADFYNAHGFKMMVLKGYACSLDWPKPEHRPCGDIDIWQFGQQKEADAVLAAYSEFQISGSKIDNSHHHHTVFCWRDFIVENHYDFIEIHHHSSSPALEKILKKLGADDSYFVEMTDASTPSTCSGTGSVTKVYLPSPNLHALFLLRHAMEHFASTDINLRQLLDWAFFVKAHGEEVDWEWLYGVMEEFGMKTMFNIFNAICVEDLGFEVGIFPAIQFEPVLKERVLNDILSPEFSGEEPKSILRRVLFKYCRWKANGWKQKLCYKGSRWSAFWSATWNHILKPKSI